MLSVPAPALRDGRVFLAAGALLERLLLGQAGFGIVYTIKAFERASDRLTAFQKSKPNEFLLRSTMQV